MPLDPQDALSLIDAHSTLLGTVSIDRIEGIRVFGRFQPSDQFRTFQALFDELEHAVNEQLFSLVDEICTRIDQLGLQLASRGGRERIKLAGVQLMNRTDICFEIPHLALVQLPAAVAQEA